MNCFYHRERPAIGICTYCHRGLCEECSAIVEDSLTCKDRHEIQVSELQLWARRGAMQTKQAVSAHLRSAIFYTLVGMLFMGFGLMQYRFLGWQAVFFALIGAALLYAGIANFLEARKYG
jgi:hypothetical protein